MLQQQISEVGRWLGAVFEGTLGKILPYINGFVMAIKEMIKTFALFIGYEIPDSTGSVGNILDQMGDSSDDLQDSIGGVNGGLDSTEKKLKKIKNLLSSKDELNIIQEPEDTASGGGGGAGGFGSIDPRILEALKDYENMMEGMRMKAMDIRDAILEWRESIGKSINDNIFAPISISWDKYGAGIMFNFSSGFNNLRLLAGDFLNTWNANWKLNFQSVSDLFFSLLETGGIVFDTITEFMLDVWNKGGRDLYDSINKLLRSFLNLATRINDDFVKPVIRWFKDNLSDAISSTFGFVLKIVGGFTDTLADMVNFLAKKGNPTLKILIGLFASFKIAKLITQFRDLTKGVTNFGTPMSKTNALTTVLTGNFGLLGKGVTTLISFFKILIKDGFSKAIQVFPKLNTLWSSSVGTVNKFASSIGTTFTSLSNLTSGIPMLSNGLGKLGGILSSASFGPWAIGITVATTAVIGLVSHLGSFESQAEKTDKKIKEFSDKRKKEVKELREETEKSIEVNLQETVGLEHNFERLKGLVDENGKLIGKKEDLQSVVNQINEEMPETIKWINEETISIDGGIETIEDYITKKKAQAIVDAELISSTKALIEKNKLLQENTKLGIKISNLKAEQDRILATEGRNFTIEEIKRLEEIPNKLAEYEGKVKANSKAISGYKKQIEDADNHMALVTKGNVDDLKAVIGGYTSFVSESYETMKKRTYTERTEMIGQEKEFMKLLEDENYRSSENITDEQYKKLQTIYNDHVSWNEKLRIEEINKNSKLMNLLNSFGYEYDNKTLLMLDEIYRNYKDYGFSSGKDFIDNLKNQLKNNKGVLDEAYFTSLGVKQKVESVSPYISIKSYIDQNSLSSVVRQMSSKISSLKFMVNADSVTSKGGGGRVFLQAYAGGGYPSVGELFIANEKGPEMLGTMGGKPAVANQTQIDTGIENASYRGLSRALRENKSSSKSTQPIHIHIGRKTITEVVDEEEEENFMKTGKRK